MAFFSLPPFTVVPPTFTAGTGELTRGATTGGSVSLSCAVAGVPTPVVAYTPPVTDPSNAVFDNNTNMITITSAVSRQGAVRYTCTASNDVQSGVTLIYALFVGGKHLYSHYCNSLAKMKLSSNVSVTCSSFL